VTGISGDLVFLVRLAAAGALAALLGWERESSGKSAGLRTLMLVGIGSALFVELAETLTTVYGAAGAGIRADPVRAVEAVATGIGFLGAGVIFLGRGGDRIHGLTTAASIWVTAAIGLACGLGRYVLAAGATALLWIVLRILAHFEERKLQKS